MRKLYFLIVLVLLFGSVYSQNPDPNNVPKNIIRIFNTKFPNATQVAWDTTENNYIADFINENRLTSAEFSTKGTWLATIEDQNVNDLYQPIQKHIEENYKKHKIQFAEKAVTRERDDYYYVQLWQRSKDGKPKITKLFFDKTGNIERTIQPDGLMIVGGGGNVVNTSVSIPEEISESFEKRFVRAEEIEWDTVMLKADTIPYFYVADFVYRDQSTVAHFSPSGEWILTKEEMSPKDLYSPIERYLDENFKEHKVMFAEKVVQYDRNNYYYVQVEMKDDKYKDWFLIHHYFDKTGNLTRVVKPEELIDENAVKPPENVLSSFERRFRRATDVQWETSNGHFVVNCVYRDEVTAVEFTPEGDWVSTTTEVDPKDLYGPIERTLDEKYQDYKVVFAEKTRRKDRNDYYYLELYSKKRKVTPQSLVLFFDRVGRPIDGKPETE